MPDEAAVVRAGKTAVGDQGCLQGQTPPVEEFHGLVHFPHTGSPFGSLIANHDDLAFLDPAFQNSRVGLFFIVKAVRRSGKSVHIRMDGGRLGNGAVGRQIAAQNGESALIAPWVLHCFYNHTVGSRGGSQVFGQGFAGYCKGITV